MCCFFGLPLAAFPAQLSGFLWVLFVGLAWIAAIAWARESWYWLLWLPMWDALRVQQVSAAIVVAAIVAVGSLRRGSRMAFLVAILVMSIKPQQTVVLLVALVWWARAWWRSMVVVWGSIAVLSFAVQPDWVTRWVDQIAVRSELVAAEWWVGLGVLPLGLWLLGRGWRESALAVLSTLAGPWPLGGPYVTAAWPLGTAREQGAACALVGLLAYVVAILTGWYWAYPLVMLSGLAIAGWALPVGRRSLGSFE